MSIRKSVLLLTFAGAFLGCPGDETPPPPPPPPVADAGVQTPCDVSSTQGLLTRDLPMATQTPRPLAAMPDARGRVGVIVGFQPGRYAPEVLASAGLEVVRELPGANLVATRMTADERTALTSHPDVRAIELDRTVRSFGLRGSLPLGVPWLGATPGAGTGEIPWGVRAVQAPEVWDVDEDGELDPQAPAGQGIKVCVLDSGADLRHPEMLAMYAGGRDFLDNDDDPSDSAYIVTNLLTVGGGHGTHVAGTIGARYGNGGSVAPTMSPGGVVGVAPAASILVARVLDVEGSGDTSTIIAAMDWCVAQGAQILNLSLGSDENSTFERDAVNRAVAAGALVIAASGNDGKSKVGYPAAFQNAIAVGAVDSEQNRAEFSQFGLDLDLVGPGVDVLSASVLGAGGYSRVLPGSGVEVTSSRLSGSGLGQYTGAVVDCGLGDSYESCGEGATCGGFVALVRRGGLTFGEKAAFVVGQGAKAIVIANNVEEDPPAGNFTLGRAVSVPVVSVGLVDGEALLADVGGQLSVEVVPTDYELASGTSMATPHVSGVAAVVWSAASSLPAADIREALEQSALDLGSEGKDSRTGFGLVQAKAAIEYLRSQGKIP